MERDVLHVHLLLRHLVPFSNIIFVKAFVFHIARLCAVGLLALA